jgi:hypothetical protein
MYITNPFIFAAGFENVWSTQFDGLTMYAEDTGATNTTMGITTHMTCSFWVKANGTVGPFDTFIGNSTVFPSTADGFGFYWVSNTMRFYINSYNAHYVSAACTINDGNWYHVVGTYNGTAPASPNQITMYVNAVQGSWKAHTNSVTGTNPLLVGKAASGTGYVPPAIIDEVAVWNVVLTPTEVTEIYNSGEPTNLADFSGTAPKVWYRMGDGATFPNIPDEGSVGTGGLTMYNMLAGDIIEDVPS